MGHPNQHADQQCDEQQRDELRQRPPQQGSPGPEEAPSRAEGTR
jgi:hypothetical protein